MGDFNMLPGSPEYEALTGRADHEFGKKLIAGNAVDAAARLGVSGEGMRSPGSTPGSAGRCSAPQAH